MGNSWDRLKNKLEEISDLASAGALLGWDQAVMMPPGGGSARARALATMQGLVHDRVTDPEIGELLADLEGQELDRTQAASIRVLRRDYDRATKVPGDLVRAIAEAEGHAYNTWTQARPANDFASLAPHLDRLFALKREEADAYGWTDERYDALIDAFEPGMTTKRVESMFDELLAGLKPLVDRILDRAGPRPEWLTHEFDPIKQQEFCAWLIKELGFDLTRGRLDTSPHPFTITISRSDVRQTTKAEPRNLMMSIYAVIHETGHALYEQGIPEEMTDLPVGRVPSLGLHESQSRMWENQVGRGRPFTDFLLPHLKEKFPDGLGMLTPEDWHKAVNHPQRTLIRVTADELTYNLHVALRFELEVALFRDELEVADLPGAWNEKMSEHVGITPPNDSDGVLQDMHWSMGAIGYFPTYTLGTLYSAAFFDAALAELGDLSDELRHGDGSRLLAWLRENIHEEAYLQTAGELAEKVAGGPVGAEPFLRYVERKYEDLF